MKRFALPQADWPKADQALMDDLFVTGGPLDDVGPLCRLRPATQASLRVAYARWLGWLASTDAESLVQVSPIARATTEHFHSWVASLRHLAPETRLTMAVKVLRVLKAAAPEAQWRSHTRTVSVLRWQSSEHRSTRKDGRIVSSAVLLRAARDKSEAHDLGATPVNFRSVKARRDAAMIAFLTVLPIRFRSFCHLEIGTSLRLTARGLCVVLDADDLKSGQHWETPVPSPLSDILADYLEHIRPVLQSRGERLSQSLWLNDHGRPYNQTHLSDRFRRITRRLVGVRITPHFFRDCAATTLAYDSPDSARLTRALLGHTNFRTGTKHYNQATAIQVGRDYAGLLARLGDKLP